MDLGNTKQEILEASLELFSVQGFESTSISQIADAVGIRKASLYSHSFDTHPAGRPWYWRLFPMENEENRRRRKRKLRQDWNPHWLLKLLYTDCHMMLLQFLIVNDVIPA